MSYTKPAPFVGTEAELSAARRTHVFINIDGDTPRCGYCDARMGSTSAGWPCGEDIPRIVVED